MSENEARDARLRNLLRSALPSPPIDEVDWAALHGRITTSARRVRRAPAWWQMLATWSARGIPAAAAAAIAAALMLGTVLRPAPIDSVAFTVIEEELATDLAGSLPVLIAGADEDVLDALLFHDMEEE